MKSIKKILSVLLIMCTLLLILPLTNYNIANLGGHISLAASAKLSLSVAKKTLEKGQSVTIKVKNAGAKKVTWSSSNSNVATVSNKGVVNAVGIGKTNIIAKIGQTKLKAEITVVQKTKQNQYTSMSDDMLLKAYNEIREEAERRKLKLVKRVSLNEGKYIVGEDIEPGIYLITCTSTSSESISKSFDSLGTMYSSLDPTNSNLYSDMFSSLGNLYSSVDQGLKIELIGDYGNVQKTIYLKKGESKTIELKGKIALKISDGSCILQMD